MISIAYFKLAGMGDSNSRRVHLGRGRSTSKILMKEVIYSIPDIVAGNGIDNLGSNPRRGCLGCILR